MKDVLGYELKIGDHVVTVFDNYVDLIVCKVVGFTRKKVYVELESSQSEEISPLTRLHFKSNSKRLKFPSELAKVKLMEKTND